MDAVGTLEGEVRELIRRSGLDPARDVPEVRRLVAEAVSDYDERSLHGGMPTLPDLDEAAKALWDSVAGFGPLQRYFDDPSVEEIWVNEPSKVFIARDGIAELTTTILTADVLCTGQGLRRGEACTASTVERRVSGSYGGVPSGSPAPIEFEPR